MPNGDDKNWVRFCVAVDGFRARYGRWPTRVRMMDVCYADLIGHVLSPPGYALVSTFVELVAEEDAAMIADDGRGAEFNYGREEFPGNRPEPSCREFFGDAVLRRELG